MEFGMLAMYWGGLPFTSRGSGESREETVQRGRILSGMEENFQTLKST